MKFCMFNMFFSITYVMVLWFYMGFWQAYGFGQLFIELGGFSEWAQLTWSRWMPGNCLQPTKSPAHNSQ